MAFLTRFLRTQIFGLAAAVLFCTASVLPARAAETLSEIRQLSAGESHACAVTHGGALYCWGENRFGQIGDGTMSDGGWYGAPAGRRNPTLVFVNGAMAVSTGYAHTCAVVNGGLFCWGRNFAGQVNGQLGEKNVLRPVKVLADGVTDVAAGGQHTCAVVRGAALCWGQDERALGRPRSPYISPPSLSPVTMVASGVTAIAARGQSTCAVANGALQCWGDNRYGQIKELRSDGFVEPTELIAGGVSAVSVGGSAICAVVSGALQCWGRSVAPNSLMDVPKPTTVLAHGVTNVSAMFSNVCAVVNGGLQCWGVNDTGSMGAGEKWSVVTSPTVLIPDGVTAVGLGGGYTCALVDNAMRCRGSNRDGVISATVPFDAYGDVRAFDIAEGDVRSLSHAQADAVIEKEQLPDKVAQFLQGKVIEFKQAVYVVRRAYAGYPRNDVRDQISFALDVTPIYTTTSARDSATDVVIEPRASCGGQDLPFLVEATDFRVQVGAEFLPLSNVFQAAFPDSPKLKTNDELPVLHLKAGGEQKITACSNAINEAWGREPIHAISLGSSDIAPSIDRSWSIPGDGEHEKDLSLRVHLKPGRESDLSVEAQSVSAMVCEGVTLQKWKRGLSNPWKLRQEVPEEQLVRNFYADENIVQAVDSPFFPAFTEVELRRAIFAEQGREGLAPAEVSQKCAPAIVGYRYMLRDGSRIVQTIYNPGFEAVPQSGCDQNLPTLAMRAADQLSILRGQRIHSAICKSWPGDASKTLVALVREKDGSTQGMSEFDLDVMVVKTNGTEILQHLSLPNAIVSDAIQFEGITLDTANYSLAPGQRAFGLRARYGHNGGVSSSHETLSLYLPVGKTLKIVLDGIATSESVWMQGVIGSDCNETSDTTRTVAIGKTRKYGYFDLVITEYAAEQHVEKTQKGCSESIKKSNHRYQWSLSDEQYFPVK